VCVCGRGGGVEGADGSARATCMPYGKGARLRAARHAAMPLMPRTHGPPPRRHHPPHITAAHSAPEPELGAARGEGLDDARHVVADEAEASHAAVRLHRAAQRVLRVLRGAAAREGRSAHEPRAHARGHSTQRHTRDKQGPRVRGAGMSRQAGGMQCAGTRWLLNSSEVSDPIRACVRAAFAAGRRTCVMESASSRMSSL
jgi:hypothetical protein